MEGVKLVNVKMTPETHRRLKVAAAEDGVKLMDLTEKLILEYLERRDHDRK